MAALQIHGDADTVVPYDGDGLMPSAMAVGGVVGDEERLHRRAHRHRQDLDIDYRPAGATRRAAPRYSCPHGAAELWTIHGGQHMPSFVVPDWGNDVFDWLMAHPKS